MKKLILFLSFCLVGFGVSAKHIIGGEMFYTYLGKGTAPNTWYYQITLRLFRDDFAPPDAALMPMDVWIGIFDNGTGQQYPRPGEHRLVQRSSYGNVKINPFPECMVNAPKLGYHAAEFSFKIELPINSKGYTAAYQTCCRIRPIDNIISGGSGEGSTFSCEIPPDPDTSPEFISSIDAVCGGKRFNLEFGAVDSDGDSLSYSFENAYDGGIARDAGNINPSAPPYRSVTYVSPFNALSPLGKDAFINPTTGTISGIAPRAGRYVVTVAVTSWRNGQKLAVHRKDFIINVSDCDFATAKLDSLGVLCDSSVVTFHNDDFSPLNKTFYWEFYDVRSNLIETSNESDPMINFPDTGVYRYKLVINRGEQCSDSTENELALYPGFFPNFNFDGQCINADVLFTDHSSTVYGTVNSWKWDFGASGINSDTSSIRNPKYLYDAIGDYNVSLTIGSSLGCTGTISKIVSMVEKPEFSVTNDTLICSIDQLQLSATGHGKIEWSPNYNMNDIHSFNPVVSPKHTTTYYASYEESRGCTNMDSVVVNVVDFVSLQMPSDTTICLTDSVLLSPISNGLHYTWSTGGSVIPGDFKDLLAVPAGQSNTFNVVASIGGCSSNGFVQVATVPYPLADAGLDTTLCLGNSVQLTATGGSFYTWQPAIFLSNTNIHNPISSPTSSVTYVVRVTDNKGCPKPVFDSVTVAVTSPFVDAGPRDTAIVIDQPLQLNAVGNGIDYLWTPAFGLDDPTIPNPLATSLTGNQTYVVRMLTAGDCLAMDTINVKIYNLKPGFYVPNAFTPNNDGLNDRLVPIGLGLQELKYFRIFNRYGELVFSTNSFEQGWDGTFKGSPQTSNTFVWTGEATDYLGNAVKGKGTITLIR